MFTCTNDSTDVYQFVSSYINVLSSSLASAAFSFHLIFFLHFFPSNFTLLFYFCLLAYGFIVIIINIFVVRLGVSRSVAWLIR